MKVPKVTFSIRGGGNLFRKRVVERNFPRTTLELGYGRTHERGLSAGVHGGMSHVASRFRTRRERSGHTFGVIQMNRIIVEWPLEFGISVLHGVDELALYIMVRDVHCR